MSPDQFSTFAATLPQSLCLIDSSGQVLAANPAAVFFFETDSETLVDKSLFELVVDNEDKVKNTLRIWSRSRTSTPGPLQIRTANQQIISCHCHGSLVQPKSETTPALILLRIERKEKFTKSFSALNEKITLLQKEIKEHQQAARTLAQRNSEFEAMFNSIPDAVIFVDTQRKIIRNNPAVHSMFGYSDQELIGNTTEIFYADKKDYRNQGNRRYRTGSDPENSAYEIRYARKDGTKFWSETLGTQVKNADDEIIGYIALIRDITERRHISQELQQHRNHLEAMVSERTMDLSAANKELEAFSYSVSHDLISPLRAIDGFSQALLEDYAEQLDTTGQHFLHRVRDNAQRMGTLINDLLSLSKVTKGELDRQTIDLSAIAHACINQLQEQEPQRNVAIHISPEIKGWADKRLMNIALSNLLGNAWKYTAKKSKPKITFGATETDEGTIYHVRDDGAGFNMEHADQLFTAFQRLHEADEFDGTGIGLATVARIILRHGGKVWAEAEVDQGATFFFTLSPKQ